MKPTTDRRVLRTQARLRQALLELILEKPYDSITVQNILDRADVSRSAFYANYQDKEALLLSGMPTDILSYGLKNDSDNLIPSVEGLFDHILQGRVWLKAMGGSAGLMLTSKKARERMVENWLTHIHEWETAENISNIPAEAVSHYLTGALMSLLLWWIGEDMKTTPAAMNQLFQQLAGTGLVQLFRN